MTTIRRYRHTEDSASLRALLDAARLRGELPDVTERDVPMVVDYADAASADLGVAVDPEGRLVGVVCPEMKFIIIEPDHRRHGIGRALAAEGIAIERERGRPNLLMGPIAGDEAAEAFLRRIGFYRHSTVWRLDLPAGAEVPLPDFPTGFVARPFEAGDEGAYVEVVNASFADHPTPVSATEEIAAFMSGHADFIPTDHLFLARDDEPGRFVALCNAFGIRETAEGPFVEGEIALIGVRPGYQGQGLGRELLRWGVSRVRSLGIPNVFLTVNVTNERALGLYQRHGFRKTKEKPRWALPVDDPG